MKGNLCFRKWEIVAKTSEALYEVSSVLGQNIYSSTDPWSTIQEVMNINGFELCQWYSCAELRKKIIIFFCPKPVSLCPSQVRLCHDSLAYRRVNFLVTLLNSGTKHNIWNVQCVQFHSCLQPHELSLLRQSVVTPYVASPTLGCVLRKVSGSVQLHKLQTLIFGSKELFFLLLRILRKCIQRPDLTLLLRTAFHTKHREISVAFSWKQREKYFMGT